MESIFCAKSVVDHGGKEAKKERRQRLVVLVTITSRSPVCTETLVFLLCDKSCLSLRACADECLASRVTSVPLKCVLCLPLFVCVCERAHAANGESIPMQLVHLPVSLENSKLLVAREFFAKFGVVTVPCGGLCVGKC